MQYIHPGYAFVRKFGLPQSSKDIFHYVNFLREEAKIDIAPPIDLSQIYGRFKIPLPHKAPLPEDTQGLLVNPEKGIILINDVDPATRQRFSEAHELIELLFSAFPPSTGWAAAAQKVGDFHHKTKEQLCNEGAAELLMPRDSFLPRVLPLKISFQTARQLAAVFNVSVSAALVHMARIGPGRHAVVLWRMKNKPTEIRNKTPEQQLSLFGDTFNDLPSKKLRVEWSLHGQNVPYIPVDKSVPEDSSIYAAWQDRKFTVGEDRLDLVNIWGMCLGENQPFEVLGEWFVLSLLHLPGDQNCWR